MTKVPVPMLGSLGSRSTCSGPLPLEAAPPTTGPLNDPLWIATAKSAFPFDQLILICAFLPAQSPGVPVSMSVYTSQFTPLTQATSSGAEPPSAVPTQVTVGPAGPRLPEVGFADRERSAKVKKARTTAARIRLTALNWRERCTMTWLIVAGARGYLL